MSNLPEIPTQCLPATEISLLDPADERSVVNLVPTLVGTYIKEHSEKHPDFFGVDEHTLYKKLRDDNKQPSPLDNRLRLKFWVEYDRVQGLGLKSMTMINVLAGICSKELFYNNYLKRVEKIAWLLCPPTGYMAKAEEALEFGLEQLRDILELPHSSFGKADVKLGELKAKIVAMLDNRVKGAVVQKNMNFNLSASGRSVEKLAAAETGEDLMKQLKELDRKNRRAQNLPDIEVKREDPKEDG